MGAAILGEAWIKAYDSQHEDNFSQAGDLYRLMSEAQKNQLAANIAEEIADVQCCAAALRFFTITAVELIA